MKKKILAMALALLMLTGCASGKTDQAPTAAPTQETAAPPAQAATEAPAQGNLVTLPATEPTTAPTAAPTTQPATEPAPTAAPAIVITKHPSSETVSAGARTWFIASAENDTQITWEFFSPDGVMYSLEQTVSAHPGLVLEVLPEDTLGLRQIPASFNGWSARARYDGPGGTATTQRATITVRDPYGDVIETYRAVHRTGTGNIEKGISEMVNNYDFLGYTTMDLDGNGVQELILASDAYNEYPNLIYEVYTLQNGKAVSVTQSRARERYFMLRDGRFLMEGSSGAAYSHWMIYNFSISSLMLQEEIWTSDMPHDMADFAPYYYYSLPYGPEEPIVYDEAARTIENWEREIWLPALTPIN